MFLLEKAELEQAVTEGLSLDDTAERFACSKGAPASRQRDSGEKRFGLSVRGLARSIETLREEGRKCVLLCANGHAEVEGGVSSLSLQ